ncbi:hypothetical protein N8I71_03340 [Roseibacterium sp. SDUM158016]|uniref:hypothetical protein n=1 Tax=Roseicyclus sediminis TaxID=2980997 RepID=UPI0021D0DB6D|nr:hypothetical protein [Roseibacterium sp. SDUM158016]MCU4651847.1 hypothetical protein [Roseibacterium sp. SDUM158016]
MANTDSFIDEVTEEVRRDRLFAFFRKWAWLAVLIVVVLVGGAGFLEYRRAQAVATSQAFGDAVIAALDQADSAARISALEAVDPPGAAGEVLLALLAAGEAAEDEDRVAAAARLRAAAEAPDLPVRYRHLALLKAHLLDQGDPAEARLVLGVLAEPGAPYAALAEEQLALLDISEGDLEAGIERLRRLEIAAEATPGLQQRAGQLIVALESGAALVDTAPEPVAEPDAGPVDPADALGGDGALLPPTDGDAADGAVEDGTAAEAGTGDGEEGAEAPADQ